MTSEGSSSVERMYGKQEMSGPDGFFKVAPRTPHVWRDRGELPPADNDGEPVNGSDAWAESTLLRFAVRTGRVYLIRDPEKAALARKFHVEQVEQAAAG